tara:strand:+ start:195 stop:665 length:471 start_codon:yes stop_codon:yes gene_type:complete
LYLKDYRELLVENICFSNLKKLNLEKIQLKKTSTLNQYLYQSKGFKILKWYFKPEIIFLIIYEENNIFAESNEKLMKGLNIFSDIIEITVNFNILKRGENSLKIKRTVYLRLKKTPTFLRFIPNKILKKFLNQALDLIATRVDKKLLFKLLLATQK